MRAFKYSLGSILMMALVLAGSPSANAQNEKSELQFLYSLPMEGPDYFPCANGGEGEAGWLTGVYEIWAKTVTTPSGHTLQQGELRGSDVFVSNSGETWVSGKLHNHIFYHYHKKMGGGFLLNEPIWVEYSCIETGEKVAIKWLYHMVMDADFNMDEKHSFIKLQGWKYIKK
ncbi:hypothetical protein ACFL39_02105 [Gemmatimonadota bacterium]